MRHNFKKLKIWEKAMDLSDKIYSYTEGLPAKERYNLIDQLNRCSVSIPSNIAEGSGKRTKNHFAEFLSTSLTSTFEAETQLLICQRRKYGNLSELKMLLDETSELQKMIYNFRETILNGN
jgi:four helix bundle protein